MKGDFILFSELPPAGWVLLATVAQVMSAWSPGHIRCNALLAEAA